HCEAVHEQRVEAAAVADLLAARERDPRGARELGPRGRLARGQWVLKPERVVLFGRTGDAHRERERPAAAVEQHVDLRPVGVADAAQRLESSGEMVGRDVGASAFAGLERPDLHRREALLEEARRELLGSLERRAVVLVGAGGGATDAPAGVVVTGARVVDADALAD